MKDGWIYYVGVFFLNGMAGVLSKLYGEAPFEKGSSAVYSIWIAICTALISGVILILMHKRIQKPARLATLCAAGYGACNSLGNYWLVAALAFVPASVLHGLGEAVLEYVHNNSFPVTVLGWFLLPLYINDGGLSRGSGEKVKEI